MRQTCNPPMMLGHKYVHRIIPQLVRNSVIINDQFLPFWKPDALARAVRAASEGWVSLASLGFPSLTRRASMH
jgi:hypothetical protein